MEEHKRFLRIAFDLAKSSVKENNGGPFGAVIVKDGQIVGKGMNGVTSHNDPTAHAEIVAIRDACKNLNDFQLEDCTIYSSCEPCPMCLGAIYWARPKALFFGASKKDASNANFDDSFIYKELKRPLNKRKINSVQLLQEEGKLVFECWHNKEDKINY